MDDNNNHLATLIKTYKMKKIIYPSVVMVLFLTAMVVHSNVFSQNTNGGHFSGNTMVSLAAVGDIQNEIKDDEVTPKALKHFNKTFKEAGEVKWMTLSDGYAAKFIYNGITQRVFYNKQGSLVGVVKGYTGDMLPDEIQSLVERKNPGYVINHTDEIELARLPGRITYIVQLQRNQNLKVIRISEGE